MADAGTVFQGFVERGFSPVQAAVLTGNFQEESGFDPKAYNPKEDAFGAMQWRLDRKSGLENYAKATGRTADDIDAQLDWVVKEMTGPEAKNAAAFLAAQDVPTANAALRSYIRYAPASEGARLKNSLAYAGEEPTMQVAQTQSQGFVNPAGFNGSIAPVPQYRPTVAPAGPAGAPAAAPVAVPSAAPSISDDDLMKAFLTPANGNAPAAQAPGAPLSEDDALLQSFLTPAAELPKDPLEGTSQLFPGADALSAAFTSAVDAIPIVGRPLMDKLTELKAAVHGGDPAAQAQIEEAIRAQQPVASGVGTVTGTVAPYLIGGAIPGVAKALGMSGNLLTRMTMGGLSGAGITYGDTLSRGGTQEEAQRNALIGGALGTAAAPVADVVGAGLNKLLSGTSKEVAELAKLAKDKFGIEVGPGQISDNGMVRFADSVVNKMPLSGGTASTASQQTAFNKAVANTFGETAEQITPQVMANAKQRIGDVFDSVAQRTSKIDYDQPLEQALINTVDDAGKVLTGEEVAPIKNIADAIVSKFGQGNGAITGEVYQALTRKGTPLDRLLSSANPNIRYYAQQVRNSLDDALQRFAPADAVADLTKARSQYKAMKTIEDLVEKAPTGDISPPLLMNAVRQSYDNMAYGGGGDLAELARIGQRFLKAPPSSGTAERGAVMVAMDRLAKGVGGGGALAAAALNPGAIPMALATGIPAIGAYALASKGAGALMRSKTLANKLIDNSLGTGVRGQGGGINVLTRSGVPLIEQRQPVEIMVRGGNPLLAQ